jgi:NhaP-type Na+/H+ or K+/H+ antiporter
MFYFYLFLAIDPVAILSIFQVLNVDQLLYMLVFGESILNDAVAIVLTNVIVESKRQFENLNTTKLTAYSMIGLLASSNLTTIPSVTNSLRYKNNNGLIHNKGQGSFVESRGDLSPIFSTDNDKYPLINNENEENNEPVLSNDYFDENKNIPPKKKRRQKSKFKRAIQINTTTTSLSTQVGSSIKTLMQISTRFSLMFYTSGFLGLLFGLTSALLTKYLAFGKSSLSLEISLLLLTAYASYMFAELCHLSGIMSILVCGLTMSHYTHENLSNVGRQSITVLFRTIAFLAETCVFLYLGLGIFEYQHAFHPKLIFWTILLTLVGRAAHVFPLSFVMNCFRSKQHRITFSMQLIMWFAGLRGAISYALSVHVGQYYGTDEEELKRTLVTTTLVTVLFTILVLGGLTMPVVKYLRKNSSSSSQQRSLESFDDDIDRHTMMSKTIQFDELLNEDENYMHQRKQILNDDIDNYEIHFANPNTMKGLEKLNEFYIKPLLVRKTSLKPNDEQEIRQHDRKPLLSSNGKKSSFINDDDDDDDDDGEDDLLVVNQLRQENFQLKTIKDSKRINQTSHNT